MAIIDTAVHDIDITRWLLGEEIVATRVLTPRRNGHAVGMPSAARSSVRGTAELGDTSPVVVRGRSAW